MLLEVVVPDNCNPGDQFLVETDDGCQFTVTVPHDAHAGMAILVDLPVMKELVDVVVPDGCEPGAQFFVEHGGQEFCVVVPDGIGPGMTMQVQVPKSQPPSQTPSLFDASSTGESHPQAFSALDVSMSDRSTVLPKKPPLTLSLGLIGGLELKLSLAASAKYHVGDQVRGHIDSSPSAVLTFPIMS